MIKQCILLLAISGLTHMGAGAQTWRIARASHSGSADEPRSGEDNFGLPYRTSQMKDTARTLKRREKMPKKPAPLMHKRVRKVSNSAAK